jgi:hypothetical protein
MVCCISATGLLASTVHVLAGCAFAIVQLNMHGNTKYNILLSFIMTIEGFTFRNVPGKTWRSTTWERGRPNKWQQYMYKHCNISSKHLRFGVPKDDHRKTNIGDWDYKRILYTYFYLPAFWSITNEKGQSCLRLSFKSFSLKGARF